MDAPGKAHQWVTTIVGALTALMLGFQCFIYYKQVGIDNMSRDTKERFETAEKSLRQAMEDIEVFKSQTQRLGSFQEQLDGFGRRITRLENTPQGRTPGVGGEKLKPSYGTRDLPPSSRTDGYEDLAFQVEQSRREIAILHATMNSMMDQLIGKPK